MHTYQITWHTAIAPGITYYQGNETFNSNYTETDEVEIRFKNMAARRAAFAPSMVIVTGIKRIVR